MTKNR